MIQLHNDILKVEIDQTNLALTVTDLRSGVCWRTPGGGFDLQVYDIALQNYRWCAPLVSEASELKYGDNLQSPCAIRITRASGERAVAEVDFANLDLGFVLEFVLQGAELTIVIPERGWNLSGERANEVISLDCFPFFGGRPRGSEGYLLLPHFGGALRYFADQPGRAERTAKALRADPGTIYAHEREGNEPDPDAPQSYTGMVYGQQANWRDQIAYPLWGAVVGDSGWAAYVPFGCGDADTGIVTSSNRGKEQVCAVYPRFFYREHAHDTRVAEDRKLVLTFLHESGLNYASIGRLYRRYLVEKEGVPTLRQKCEASPQTDYLVGAHYTCPYLALKRYHYVNNPNPDGKGILDVYLTCDQSADELRRWKKAGVAKAMVHIVGCNHEGHDGNHPTIFPIEPKVGGEEGLKRLVATIQELGYRSSVHINIRGYFRAAPDFRIEHVIRDRDGALLYGGTGPGGEGYEACPEAIRRDFVTRNFGRLKALGLDGGLYTDYMLGTLFRCYHPRHPLTRRSYLTAVKAYLHQVQDVFGAVRMESVVAPILDVLDAVLRINVFETSEGLLRGAEMSQRGLVDQMVPLQAIIFHGILLYNMDKTCIGVKDYWAHVLRLVSVGAKPIEELRGPQPQWDDLHAFEYQTLCERLRWLQFEQLVNLEQSGAATRTVYSDGTVVWVNHGRESVPADGRQLPARSFWVKPGGDEREEIWIEEDPSLCDRAPAPFPDGSSWPDGRAREGAGLTPASAP